MGRGMWRGIVGSSGWRGQGRCANTQGQQYIGSAGTGYCDGQVGATWTVSEEVAKEEEWAQALVANGNEHKRGL